MVSRAIKRAFLKAQERGWEKLYLAIDIHDTMIPGNYVSGQIPTKFYRGVIETLKLIQARGDIRLILYTCSHPHEIIEYDRLFLKHGVDFDHFNENPEVITKPQGLGCYDKKFYFDILFEDKAGFDPEEDWTTVYNLFMFMPILTKHE